MRSLAVLVRMNLMIVMLMTAAATAEASMVFSNQMRRVEVRDFAPVASDSAADFGLFSRTVSWTDPVEGHGGSAMQRSELLVDRVQYQAALTARDGRSGFQATASSKLDVVFTLDQPTGAELRGTWWFSTETSGVSLLTTVRLSRDEALVWSTVVNRTLPPAAATPFGHGGELSPGAYRLEIVSELTANQSPGFTTGTGAVNVEFVIPAPGEGVAMAAVGVMMRRRRRGGC